MGLFPGTQCRSPALYGTTGEGFMDKSTDQDRRDEEFAYFRRRVFFVFAAIGLIILAFLLREILLLAFAGVLFGMIFRAAGKLVGKVTRMGERTSLGVAVALIFVLVGLAGWLAAPLFANQLPNLFDRVDEAVGQIEDEFGIDLPSNVSEIFESISGFGSQVVSGVVTAAGMVVSAITAIVLVLAAGIYFAAEPQVYRKGVVLLFPLEHHGRVRRGLRKVGSTLLLWLKAQFLTMIVVGLLTGVGAWAIGLPAPIALGVFAGLGEFIPILGPFIAAIPALLVAFGEGGSLVVWTLVLYVVIQQVEGNIITPLVQREMLSIPPVLLLLSLLAMGVFFGIVGIIVAAPLTVAGYVMVREFYVRDYLDEGELLDGRNADSNPI